jgi:hypothetical protein
MTGAIVPSAETNAEGNLLSLQPNSKNGDRTMIRIPKLFIVSRLIAAAVLGLAVMSIAAEAQSLSAGAGSGENRADASASLGGGGMDAGGLAQGPSGTTSSGSLSIGRGRGFASNVSSAPAGDNRTNFTSAFNRNATGESLRAGNGDTSFGFDPGTTGSVASVPGAPAEEGQATGIAGAPTAEGIASVIGDLSPADRQLLARKCALILAAPQRHGADALAVCRVLASL